MIIVNFRSKFRRMKTNLTLLAIVSCLIVPVSWSQDNFSRDFEPIRKDLRSWDPIRGEWLASSLEAMSRNEPVPDRTFPEDFTPAEMLRIVPASSQDFIRNQAQQNNRVATDNTPSPEWGRLNNIVSRPNCRPVIGRSYGDPHLVSFDNASYSFQTVGEFVLARSSNRDFEVQTRQSPQGDNFSLNTAVAMNVAGDRLTFYAENFPDAFSTTPMRLNGQPIQFSNATYYLPHGGTVRPSGNSFLVTWPTGETANIQRGRSGGMSFFNVTVSIFPCAGTFEGLLGNANGRASDDFEQGRRTSPSMLAFSTFGNSSAQRGSNAAEKEYLAFLARDFANDWRINQTNSLFDYGFGQSTLTFTDYTFPRVHHTVADLSNDRQSVARRNCENAGVSREEMGGCIFDQGHLDIPPSPRPEVKDPTVGYKPERLEKPVRNVNPDATPQPMKPIEGGAVEKPQKGSIHPDLLEKPNSQATPQGTDVKKPENGQVKPVETEETVKPVNEPVKPVDIKETTKPVGGTINPSVDKPKPSSGVKPSGSKKPAGGGAVTPPAKPKPSAPKPSAPSIGKPGKG